MKSKKILLVLAFIFILLILMLIKKANNKINVDVNESDDIMIIKAIIDDTVVDIKLEDSNLANEFINLLPMELTMNELNGNEKYAYLNTTFTVKPTNPKHINKGDVMIYGNNCLVIFYKSFDTSYTYTKLGHIDNLPNLDKDEINIKFEL